jgi:hypothetical protein
MPTRLYLSTLFSVVGAKELKFMHITKTGGTSIEAAGRQLNLSWGKHHSATERAYGFWHALPTTKNPALLQKYDWFTVVRNPFDRVVSEFWCRWGGEGRPKNVSVLNFNAFISKQVTLASHRYVGHYTPQIKYLSILNVGPDVVLRVLHFERLQRDFSHLLKMSRLPDVKLPMLRLGYASRRRRRMNTNSQTWNVSHLTLPTIKLIQHVYQSDFEVFGYSKDAQKAQMR